MEPIDTQLDQSTVESVPGTPLIFDRLVAIMEHMGFVPRASSSGTGSSRSIYDLLPRLQAGLLQNRVLMLPHTERAETTETTWEEPAQINNKPGIKRKSNTHALVEMTYTFICADDGSSVAIRVAGEASDYGDKALTKAHTYAQKTAILQLFAIPDHADDRKNDSDKRERKGDQRGDNRGNNQQSSYASGSTVESRDSFWALQARAKFDQSAANKIIARHTDNGRTNWTSAQKELSDTINEQRQQQQPPPAAQQPVVMQGKPADTVETVLNNASSSLRRELVADLDNGLSMHVDEGETLFLVNYADSASDAERARAEALASTGAVIRLEDTVYEVRTVPDEEVIVREWKGRIACSHPDCIEAAKQSERNVCVHRLVVCAAIVGKTAKDCRDSGFKAKPVNYVARQRQDLITGAQRKVLTTLKQQTGLDPEAYCQKLFGYSLHEVNQDAVMYLIWKLNRKLSELSTAKAA